MNNEEVPWLETKRPLRSPLLVYLGVFLSAFLWACVYDASVGRPTVATDHSGGEAADDEDQGEIRTEGGTTVGEDSEDDTGDGSPSASAEDPTVRTGPRVRHPRPEDVAFGVDIALEDRDGRSMAPLHEALRRAERGEGQARLVFYGASHVASDLFTGRIRRYLQRRFGDAGHGFILPVHPWRSYRHRDIRIRSDRGDWDMTKVRGNTREIDHFGLHGVFVETSRRNAWGEVRTPQSGEFGRNASSFELFFMKQPRGGDFSVFLDGRPVERVSTRGEEIGPGYARYEAEDGPHSLMIRTRGNGPVRLYGVAVERERPGVIVDTLGINGARARYHLFWEDEMYREHLRRRRPDLVVLAYGTNEAGDNQPIQDYESELRQVVTRVRETVPGAACLLIGPSDRPVELENGEYEDRPRTAQLIEVQHRVAVENGCAFFDLVAYMGGPMSMVEWAAAQPPYGAPDHVHYTRAGYLRLGDVLFEAIMEGYDPEGIDPRTGEPYPEGDQEAAEEDVDADEADDPEPEFETLE